MGAFILVMTNTIGLNINHTVSVIVQCLIVAHLLGYSAKIYRKVAWAIWSPLISRAGHYH